MEVCNRWKQGGEGEGLGFLEEKHENYLFLLVNTTVPDGFGLSMGQRSRAPRIGLIGASPCSADHGWVPVGPSFLWSTGRARDIIIIVGPPALFAYMALN